MKTFIEKAYRAIVQADALLIGASNGLSIAEGYHLFADNEMFRSQFGDFRQQYGIRSVIEGCFFSYPEAGKRREFLQRLVDYWVKDYCPSQVMKDLLAIVQGKDYFIITTMPIPISKFPGLILTRFLNWKEPLSSFLPTGP